MSLVGPDGLLNQFVKILLETALEAELTEHLGHDHGETPIAANMGSCRTSKTVLAETGRVQNEMLWARMGYSSRCSCPSASGAWTEINQFVLPLSARGLTTGEIAAHFEEINGAKVSKETISRTT